MTNEQLLLVKQALHETAMREVRYYESLPQKEYEYSPKFEKKMQKLLRIQEKPIYPFIRSPMRRFASVLAIILLFFAMSLSVSAVREPVFSFFERITEKFTEIILPKEANPRVFTKYRADWVPENYELSAESDHASTYRTEWKNGDSYICFIQYTEGAHIHLNTENTIIYEASWNNRKISYCQKNNVYLFSWEENGYLFTLVCTTDLSLDDIQRMIESIRPASAGTE